MTARGRLTLMTAFVSALSMSNPVSAQQADQQPLWDEITPSTGASPSARRNAAAIYNPIDHELVLFGGRGLSGDQDDLWRFDLSTQTWEQITAGSGPTERYTHNAVYDEVAHSMVVWSGRNVSNSGSVLFSDVWSLDLATMEWSLLHPSGDTPNRRYGTAAVYDPESHTLVNFAGFTSAGRFDDTWAFHLGGKVGNSLTRVGIRVPVACTLGPTTHVADAWSSSADNAGRVHSVTPRRSISTPRFGTNWPRVTVPVAGSTPPVSMTKPTIDF